MYNDIVGQAVWTARQEKRILVCGSRDFLDGAYTKEQVHAKLTELRRGYLDGYFVTVVQGWGDGVDLAAAEWAETQCLPFFSFPANWTDFGKMAGPYRNELMLTIGKPDIVVVFPGGKGTTDMKNRADKRGIHIIEIELVTT